MKRLEDLAELYLADGRARHYSRSYLEHCGYALVAFIGWLRTRRLRDARAVGEEHVVSYVVWLRSRRGRLGLLKPTTQAGCVSVVRGFFAFLERRGHVLLNPARDVPLPKVPRLPRGVLSVSQARRLVEAPRCENAVGVRDRAILELMYGTGLRLSECARLDMQDVDLAQASLLVRNGKGRKDRHVPLGGQALRALCRYLQLGRCELLKWPLDALFVSARGARLGPVMIGLMVHERAQRLGLRATAHGLRHACATHMLKGGAGVRQVQELLGHKRLETTALYTHVAQRDLRAVLLRAHPRRGR